MKVRWIFQIAERRHSVGFGRSLDRQRPTKLRGSQRADAETEHMPAGELRHA
jgi:hypothetical protein